MTSPPAINRPFNDALPVATTTAVGVASPKAQGQAITSTAIIFEIDIPHRGSGPNKNQITKVKNATGVKAALILSVYF